MVESSRVESRTGAAATLAVEANEPVQSVETVPSPSGRRLMSGTVQVFLAESLLLPTGLLTAAFLTRQLGPDSYGVLLLVTAIVSWIGWTITSAFTRTTIKFIGETENWQAVATTVLQLHLGLGVAAVVVLWGVSEPLAIAFREPSMVNYLRLAALEIPIFCLAYVHRSIAVGLGNYSQRAISTALRWIVRMVLCIALVAAGFSIAGAIWGSIVAALVELLIYRLYIQPPLFKRSSFPLKNLWGYAIPLFLLAISLRCYEKLDLLMLKLLGGTAADVGFYGTAQNLSLIPSLFTLAFVPLLLSTLTRLLYAGNLPAAKNLSQDGMRLVLLLLPFAGLAAGSASEIITLVFGSAFLPASGLFSVLIFAAVAMAMIGVTTCILTAAGKPNWTISIAGPMVPLAIVTNGWMIPRFGALGAALTTTAIASLAAIALILVIYSFWKILPNPLSVLRSVLVGGLAYLLATLWITPGWFVLVKLTVLGLGILLGLALLGEFRDRELAFVQSMLQSGSRAVLRKPSSS